MRTYIKGETAYITKLTPNAIAQAMACIPSEGSKVKVKYTGEHKKKKEIRYGIIIKKINKGMQSAIAIRTIPEGKKKGEYTIYFAIKDILLGLTKVTEVN
jgi:fructose-specific phosphotransferase system component IIB